MKKRLYLKNKKKKQTIVNLYSPGEGRGSYKGPFTKFSFKEGKQVTGDNWDIAFRATEIIVNGGEKGKLLEDIDRTGNASMVLLSDKTLADVISAPDNSDFKQDKSEYLVITPGASNGWYTYSGQPYHRIDPANGKIIVVKTINGNYAKLEIESYYKDKVVPDANNHYSTTKSQYFTFSYVYNPNVGDKNLK